MANILSDNERVGCISGSLPRRPWVASNQYGMHFILSQDNEILWRADWMPMEILHAMVRAANEVQAENEKDQV